MDSLVVKLTQDRFKNPLLTIESSLGNGLDVTPAQARNIAAALLRAADDADSQPMGQRQVKREYPLSAE